MWCRSQAMSNQLHLLLGTHRLELPVSKMTSNDWGGVPMPTTP